MSQATLRYAASVVEKHELMKELKHWKLSAKACISEMQSCLKTLKDSEATSKREINLIRAKLVEKLKLLEERAERQLHHTVRVEEERIEAVVKALTIRYRRLDISEIRLKDTSVGHKLKRWIEDGRSQVAITKEALIGAKTSDLPTRLSFRLHKELEALLTGHSYLGVLSLESNSKTINKIVGGTEDALAQGGDGDGDGGQAGDTESTATTKMFEKELRKQLGKGMQFTDDRYFKAILESQASKSVAQKNVTQKVGNQKVTAVTVTRMDGQALRRQQGRNPDKRSVSVQDLSKNPKTKDNRTVFSAREDTRNLNDMITSQKQLANQGTTGVDVIGKKTNYNIKNVNNDSDKLDVKNLDKFNRAKRNINDIRSFQMVDKCTSTDKLNGNSQGKPNVRYLGYDFVKEITPYNKEARNPDNAQDGFPGDQNDQERPSTPQSASNGSISSIGFSLANYLASGPAQTSPKATRKAKSYFTYTSKFHTKKHPEDTDLCRLAGIAALDNGQVVVSDISHLQLMLFDSDMAYLYALECPSPSGLCVVSPLVVAVALFHNRKVLLVKVHELHLERYREVLLGCPETISGVALCHDQFYVLCFRGDIHVMESDGRHSKAVRTISTYMKEGEARSIETDQESKVILISGYERVVCFNNDGKRLWQYMSDNPKRKFSPSGIVVLHERIFVADWSGHRVVELSLAGTWVRNVIVDNVEYPSSICVCRQRGLMYVTQTNCFKQEARSRSVKVFAVK